MQTCHTPSHTTPEPVDDLSDIDPSKCSITDDPSTWILPATLVANGDLLDWWENLALYDEAVDQAGGHEAVAQLPEIAADFEQAYAHHSSSFGEYADARGDQMRSCVSLMRSYGLTTPQVARYIGVPVEELQEIQNCRGAHHTPEQRTTAEDMLRRGADRRSVADATGLTVHQVDGLVSSLGLMQSRQELRADARRAAVLLYESGRKATEVAAEINERFELAAPIQPNTVRVWAKRARTQAQETSA